MGSAREFPDAAGRRMQVRTAVLRHELPSGESHFDWLIASGAEAGSPLLTFRCVRVVQEIEECAEVEQIAEHRWTYLDYEGEVSGNRGRVQRAAEGIVEVAAGERWARKNAGKLLKVEELAGERLKIEWAVSGGKMMQEVRLEWVGGTKWKLFVIAKDGPMSQNRT